MGRLMKRGRESGEDLQAVPEVGQEALVILPGTDVR